MGENIGRQAIKFNLKSGAWTAFILVGEALATIEEHRDFYGNPLTWKDRVVVAWNEKEMMAVKMDEVNSVIVDNGPSDKTEYYVFDHIAFGVVEWKHEHMGEEGQDHSHRRGIPSGEAKLE